MIVTLSDLNRISKKIVQRFPNGGIILLVGDLASGKTTLVKNFIKEIGLDSDVSSPTFSVMNSYEDRVFHYDIYMDGTQKFLESGLFENLERDGWHFIEWADENLKTLLRSYGYEFLTVNIEANEDINREYKFEA